MLGGNGDWKEAKYNNLRYRNNAAFTKKTTNSEFSHY